MVHLPNTRRCDICDTHYPKDSLTDCEICMKWACLMCMEYFPICKECHEKQENQPVDRFEQIVEEI